MSTLQKTCRKHLNPDALLATLRRRFESLPDRRRSPSYSLADTLMAGFALFSLKDPSLIAFEQRKHDPHSNLYSVFRLKQIPSDTHMREILDEINPSCLRPCFTDWFRELQRGKVLEPFRFLDDYYLMAVDGCEHYASQKVFCPECMRRQHKNGTNTYYHQMLGAVLIHPERRQVLPLMPEPIIQQDGTTKNDCERNAAKRFFPAFRAEHPHLPVVVVGDGLNSNAPLIRELQDLRIRFVLVAHPSDHAFVFAQLEDRFREGKAETLTSYAEATRTWFHYRWVNGLPLNESNQDVPVNLLEYWEIRDGDIVYSNSWVTDIPVTAEQVELLVRGGRARWKVENETFNTLKNQGYNFEHNFGHGKQHLCTVFSILMMLAFCFDQIQQICCKVFQEALEKAGSKRLLWERMRHVFHTLALVSLLQLYEVLRRRLAKQAPVFVEDSS